MIHHHVSNPNINESHLIKYYNNLRILYDSTAQEKHMIEAMDSCIGLSIRLKTGFGQYTMRLMAMKVKYFFEKGEYYNCMNVASLAEDICMKAVDLYCLQALLHHL